MLQFENQTPFQAKASLIPDTRGVDSLVMMVKATFTLGPSLKIADEQTPILVGDEYWGDPLTSSLRYAGEFHLPKPFTDIVCLGRAQAPDRRPLSMLDTLLSVGAYKKSIRVFGDRHWVKGSMGLAISQPTSFETMPMIYERAYGGAYIRDSENNEVYFEEYNPVGKGFIGKQSADELVGQPLPNLEDPGHLLSPIGSRPKPVCPAFVAPTWLPRRSYAGTYDDAWQKKRAPYLPDDFDKRFFNTAHPDLVTQVYLQGGEPVELVNLAPNGPLQFCLPTVTLESHVSIRGRVEQPPFFLDTVLLEPEDLRFSMTWRTILCCDKKALQIDQMKIRLQGLSLVCG